ncbi:Retrovirus-related Pol polyprotein [Thelohanellus kitauei]|uniref:Retrovirus-related Pol polyprotein n=1 Tax=Thelohanellus kitauei TaxID=669202 RepID=A0A0C2M2J2_THEKT|nr:Retrovirus-related Pol polyprotein [Thelohanellus kitauei]
MSNIVCRYGIPEHIHSDRGTQFESTVFSNLCKYLGIKKLRTTPYHPMCNGMVERTNRTLKEMLRSYVSEYQDDWYKYLDLCLMGLRTSVNSSTKFSPSLIVFGREMKNIIESTQESNIGGLYPTNSYVKQ